MDAKGSRRRSATPRRTSGAPTGLRPEKHPTTAAFHVTIRGVELGRGDVSLRTTIYTFLVNELYNSLVNHALLHSRVFYPWEISSCLQEICCQGPIY